ncbi:alpha/beta hydrolase [Tamlana sedimentorum]|uniref:Alpha/beta hydrolase n=1 Tax=Neotamlana sedimentorum TaxID=1435349 RepID=A0A0D7W2E8_9FLAO|nr:alpha/beta hydrolase [Tamlana sedimentorum]KJD33285.1 alpha/beta hydrolase [Tamlana sedimentorum]
MLVKLNKLTLIFTLILITSCSNKYDKFKTTPDYINNASATKLAYYEAYNNTLKLWQVPYEELYVPTSFGIAHVIVSGKNNGDPIVLLHGMNASSTMWFPNVEMLSKNHKVFAIDFILEPGKSQLLKDIDAVESVVAWYNEIFKALEIGRFHLIGASRGGWLAVNLALNNQEQIKSLALLSPAQTFSWIKPSTDLLKNIVSLFSSKEKQLNQMLESMSNNPANIDKTYINQYKLGTQLDNPNKLITAMTPFSKNELKSLNMPVLVLIGDNDVINSTKTIEIANSLPKGKGEIIKNAGHFLSIDQAEVVNSKLINFLD